MATDEEIRITLRMPANLRDRLTREAASSGRSMNGEIVHRLEKTLEDEDAVGQLWGKVEALEEQVGVLWSVYRGRDPYNDDD